MRTRVLRTRDRLERRRWAVFLALVWVVAFTPAAAAHAASAASSGPGPTSSVQVAFTLDRAVLGSRPDTVVLSGTVSCSEVVSRAWGGGRVSQARGLTTVSADFSTAVITTCSGTPARWSATSSAAAQPFLPKAVTVTVGFVGCDDSGQCVGTPEVTQRLRLVRARG